MPSYFTCIFFYIHVFKVFLESSRSIIILTLVSQKFHHILYLIISPFFCSWRPPVWRILSSHFWFFWLIYRLPEQLFAGTFLPQSWSGSTASWSFVILSLGLLSSFAGAHLLVAFERRIHRSHFFWVLLFENIVILSPYNFHFGWI